MKHSILILLLFIPSLTFGQNSELSIFNNLAGKTWKAEGHWGNGSKFFQEIEIEFLLDSSIVITKTKGFINKEQTKLGLRNHGIRQYDKNSKRIKFWEFDVFGGLTEGIVFAEGKNIVYQYKYGNSYLTDMWEYVNDSTYNFKVGNYDGGIWKQIYLNTQLVEVNQK